MKFASLTLLLLGFTSVGVAEVNPYAVGCGVAQIFIQDGMSKDVVSGSAFIYSDQYLVTADRNLGNSPVKVSYSFDNEEFLGAEIIGRDFFNDVAVLKIKSRGPTCAVSAEQNGVYVAQTPVGSAYVAPTGFTNARGYLNAKALTIYQLSSETAFLGSLKNIGSPIVTNSVAGKSLGLDVPLSVVAGMVVGFSQDNLFVLPSGILVAAVKEILKGESKHLLFDFDRKKGSFNFSGLEFSAFNPYFAPAGTWRNRASVAGVLHGRPFRVQVAGDPHGGFKVMGDPHGVPKSGGDNDPLNAFSMKVAGDPHGRRKFQIRLAGDPHGTPGVNGDLSGSFALTGEPEGGFYLAGDPHGGIMLNGDPHGGAGVLGYVQDLTQLRRAQPELAEILAVSPQPNVIIFGIDGMKVRSVTEFVQATNDCLDCIITDYYVPKVDFEKSSDGFVAYAGVLQQFAAALSKNHGAGAAPAENAIQSYLNVLATNRRLANHMTGSRAATDGLSQSWRIVEDSLREVRLTGEEEAHLTALRLSEEVR